MGFWKVKLYDYVYWSIFTNTYIYFHSTNILVTAVIMLLNSNPVFRHSHIFEIPFFLLSSTIKYFHKSDRTHLCSLDMYKYRWGERKHILAYFTFLITLRGNHISIVSWNNVIKTEDNRRVSFPGARIELRVRKEISFIHSINSKLGKKFNGWKRLRM